MSEANASLWDLNTPARFWNCPIDIAPEQWRDAITHSFPLLNIPAASTEIERILSLTLGEQRFGPDHWNLGVLKKTYYLLKPILPRTFTRWMRQHYSSSFNHSSQIPWPIDARYVEFIWEVVRQVMLLEGRQMLPIRNLWPGKNNFALILTHDIETAKGQEFVKEVVALEESLGFRSSFNFVPERYTVDFNLMNELRERGFEVGVHGLKHDGKLFASKKMFECKAVRINQYLKDWQAVGFRADLTHRQPDWMQVLNVEYDLSFFDTDPYEPIPGGTMSIWPFFTGQFVELPYTLVQDYTLTSVLGEKSPRLWLEKIDFIRKYHGMALVNSHPDYLKNKSTWNVYYEFLNAMKNTNCYWHALPRDAARWWKLRMAPTSEIKMTDLDSSRVLLEGDDIRLEI